MIICCVRWLTCLIGRRCCRVRSHWWYSHLIVVLVNVYCDVKGYGYGGTTSSVSEIVSFHTRSGEIHQREGYKPCNPGPSFSGPFWSQNCQNRLEKKCLNGRCLSRPPHRNGYLVPPYCAYAMWLTTSGQALHATTNATDPARSSA